MPTCVFPRRLRARVTTKAFHARSHASPTPSHSPVLVNSSVAPLFARKLGFFLVPDVHVRTNVSAKPQQLNGLQWRVWGLSGAGTTSCWCGTNILARLSGSFPQGVWLWVKTNQYHFGVGAPAIFINFSGDWDVHRGYDLDFDTWSSSARAVLRIAQIAWTTCTTGVMR